MSPLNAVKNVIIVLYTSLLYLIFVVEEMEAVNSQMSGAKEPSYLVYFQDNGILAEGT